MGPEHGCRRERVAVDGDDERALDVDERLAVEPANMPDTWPGSRLAPSAFRAGDAGPVPLTCSSAMTEHEPVARASGRGAARRRSSRALVGLGSLALLLTLVFGWAADTVFDSREFADRAVAALDDDEVARLVSEKLTDQIVARGPEDLLSVQPVVEAVTLGVLRSSAFRGVARAAVADLHQAFFSEGRDSVVLDLADVVTTVLLRLQEANPDVAARIPDDVRAGALRVSDRSFATETLQLAERTRALAVLFPVLTLLLWAGAIALARDRRDAVSLIGFSAVGVSLLALLILAVAHRLLQRSAETAGAREVTDVVWASFTQPLRSTVVVVGVLGALVAAVAVALVKPVPVAERLRTLGARLARPPASEPAGAAWAAAAIGLGLLVVLQWQLAVQLAAWAIGFSLLIAGLNEIIRLTGIGQVPGLSPEELRRAQLTHARIRTRRLIRGGVLVGLVLVVGGLGFALWRSITSGPSPAVAIAGGCNGHEELCGRRLDRVALASTHNSMAAANYRTWLFAEHVGTIEEQLEDGIRGLLIDTWYGSPTDRGTVATDFDGGRSREELVELYGETTIDAAERVSGRLGADLQTREIFLCHNLCELGAVPFVETLANLRSFLDEHPGEVVVVFVQDQTDAGDVARDFEQSGLVELVWDELDKAAMADDVTSVVFPTLGEMVEKNKRVLVMAENDSGDVPWYYDGFTLTQETPFGFRSLDQLGDLASCDENRGLSDSPLFQLNHWVTTDPPTPSVAALANDYDTLFDRAIRCGQARSLVPNLVAVDFYEQGDLFAVVDTLNGVRTEAEGDPTPE